MTLSVALTNMPCTGDSTNMMKTQRILLLAVMSVAVLVWPVLAQTPSTQATPEAQQSNPDQATPNATQTAQEPAQATQKLTAGQKEKVEGVIVRRDPDSVVIHSDRGGDMTVKLSSSTKVMEKKSNPFRSAHKYPVTDLMRGLAIEAEGRADSSGALVADKIRFTDEEMKTARSVESRVTPVEGRVQSAETRLGESEQNAQRMSGQIEELNATTTAVRNSARTAQQTADSAVSGVTAANQRIGDIDNYEQRQAITVHFKVGSAILSADAKKDLDQMADQAKDEKGYVIEVAGFASADGNEAFNERLSRKRADAVVSYLVENHDIPQRRVITPMGYGAKKPVADNGSKDGRKENRRVEVKMLVSKGLVTSSENAPSSGSNAVPR